MAPDKKSDDEQLDERHHDGEPQRDHDDGLYDHDPFYDDEPNEPSYGGEPSRDAYYGRQGQIHLGVTMRMGPPGLFLRDADMPRLRSEQVAQACDNVVAGLDCYPSLVYLSRARAEDARALFDASQSPEIRIRWERLWVLSPYFAKLSRTAEGRHGIIEAMQDDLASVHLLSKFAEQHNSAVERLFKRMHDDLLQLLLPRLVDFRHDPRRAGLLGGIIAAVEMDATALEKAMETYVDEPLRTEIAPLLMMKHRDPRLSKLSSEILRDKLEQWSRE